MLFRSLRARDPVMKSDKHKLVELTAEQTKTWEARTEPVRTAWAKERAGGDKAIETYRSIYSQLKAGR